MVHTYLGYSTQIQRSLTFNDQQKVALAWRVSDMDPLIDGLLFYSGLFKKTFRSPNTAGDDNNHTAKLHLAQANQVFTAITTLTMVLGQIRWIPRG